MLPLEFILTDAHFTIGLLAAMACFATAWLYFDAWSIKRSSPKELLKWLGFGVLGFGFLVTAVGVEPEFLGRTLFAQTGLVALLLRGLGYTMLAVGLALDPLQPVPKAEDLESEPKSDSDSPGSAHKAADAPRDPKQARGLVLGLANWQVLLPVFAGVISFLYWRRALKGLERHLKPVAWAFVWFALFEVAELAVLVRGTDDPRLYGLVAPFGPMWILAHMLAATAVVILGLWVWRYLTKRVQTQLFMVLITASLVIFLVTTVSFTFLMMNRVQSQAFASLDTTSKVLGTSLAGQQAKTAADAEVVAENPDVAAAVVARDHQRLAALLGNFLTTRRQSSLMVTTESAQVLLRAEDPANWGDSVSSDSLVARAGVGKTTSGLAVADGALASRLIMKATTPIRGAGGVVVGTVTVGFVVDNAFVDGLKQNTGLASAVYSGSTRVATTLLAPDGSSRALGVREARSEITSTVLEHNKTWAGLATTGGQSYLAVYAPLRDADNAPVGMMFIGQPQVLLLEAAGWSIELTFLLAVGLLLVAIWPVHLISKSLAHQLH